MILVALMLSGIVGKAQKIEIMEVKVSNWSQPNMPDGIDGIKNGGVWNANQAAPASIEFYFTKTSDVQKFHYTCIGNRFGDWRFSLYGLSNGKWTKIKDFNFTTTQMDQSYTSKFYAENISGIKFEVTQSQGWVSFKNLWLE